MGGAWNNQRRETGGTLKWVEPKVGGARSLRVAEEVWAAGSRPPDGGGACVPFPSAHRAAESHTRFLPLLSAFARKWKLTKWGCDLFSAPSSYLGA